MTTASPMLGARCPADTIPGVLVAMNDRHGIQACDECKLYTSDLDAALALAAHIPHAVVRYHDANADEPRTCHGTDDEAAIEPDTDPWIEIGAGPGAGPVDWTTYRLTGRTGVVVELVREHRETVITKVFRITTDVPDVAYRDTPFKPEAVRLDYRHGHDGDGWSYEINLSGLRRLKSGKLGTSTVKPWWVEAIDGPIPAWAREIAEANMPGVLCIDGQPV